MFFLYLLRYPLKIRLLNSWENEKILISIVQCYKNYVCTMKYIIMSKKHTQRFFSKKNQFTKNPSWSKFYPDNSVFGIRSRCSVNWWIWIIKLFWNRFFFLNVRIISSPLMFQIVYYSSFSIPTNAHKKDEYVSESLCLQIENYVENDDTFFKFNIK
jgi:hypothetical protein